MNAQDWRLWFIQQRFELHRILRERLDAADGWEQQATEFYEHDTALHRLAKHAQKRVARADLVTVLARRQDQL